MSLTDNRVSSFCGEFLHSARTYTGLYPVSKKTIRLGSRTVEISVPVELDSLPLSPLAGLVGELRERSLPDFRIILFENAESAGLPIARWPSQWHYPLGQIPQHRTQRYRVAIDRHTGTVSVFDILSRVCGVWVYEARRLPYWWLATPFRLQFSWIADTFDAELVHAAAVKSNTGVVLLTGLSGSGKSTITHQLGLDGVPVISDDFVLAEGKKISSPYSRTKLHDSALLVLPELRALVLNLETPNQKRILQGMVSDNVATTDLALIYLVRFGPGARITDAPRRTIFRELVLGTVPGVLGGNNRSLLRLARVARAAPSKRYDTTASGKKNLEVWAADRG